MPEPHDDLPQAPEPSDEYPLVPDQPPAEIEPAIPPRQIDEGPPVNAEMDQFSLSELFGLVFVVAVLCSAVSCLMRWMGAKSTPGSLAAAYAILFGFGTLVAMVLLAVIPPVRRIITVGWWVLLGLYFVTAAAAVLMSNL